MEKLRWRALFLVTGLACASHVQAQTIYRCGNTYSQLPCPGAAPMNLSDRRLPEQKKQTQEAAINDARLANTMESERLAEEQRLLAGNRPVTSSTATKPQTKASGSVALKPKRTRTKPKKTTAFTANIRDSKKPATPKKKPGKKSKPPV